MWYLIYGEEKGLPEMRRPKKNGEKWEMMVVVVTLPRYSPLSWSLWPPWSAFWPATRSRGAAEQNRRGHRNSPQCQSWLPSSSPPPLPVFLHLLKLIRESLPLSPSKQWDWMGGRNVLWGKEMVGRGGGNDGRVKGLWVSVTMSSLLI